MIGLNQDKETCLKDQPDRRVGETQQLKMGDLGPTPVDPKKRKAAAINDLKGILRMALKLITKFVSKYIHLSKGINH